MKVKIVFKDKYLQMVNTGILKSEFPNATKLIQDFEDEVALIASKPAKNEKAEIKAGYPFDMISSITVDEGKDEND